MARFENEQLIVPVRLVDERLFEPTAEPKPELAPAAAQDRRSVRSAYFKTELPVSIAANRARHMGG